MAKKEKRMKAEAAPPEKVVAMDRDGSKAVRLLFNRILKDGKGSLTLRENAHGAVQMVRGSDGSLLFSMRSDGRLLVTSPIFDGTGKKALRVFKHPGNKWDHMSQVPFASVTLKMLQDRIKDPLSSKQWHDKIYAKKPEASGLIAKSNVAKKKIEKIKTTTASKKKAVVKKVDKLKTKTPAKKKTKVKVSPVISSAVEAVSS